MKKIIKKIIKKNSNILLITLLIGTFWEFWWPGIRVASDYHLDFSGLIDASINLPFTWKDLGTAEGLGEYSVTTLWSWPNALFHGILGKIFSNFNWLVRVIDLIFILFFSIWGMRKLLNSLQITGFSQMVGQAFYLLNTYFLLLLDGGQINLALAYSAVPIAIFSYRQSSRNLNFRSLIYTTLFFILISIFDIRIIFILGVIWMADFIHHLIQKENGFKIKAWLLNFTGIITLLLLFHSYWLVPSIFLRVPSLPPGYSDISQVNFLSFSGLTEAFFLYQPHWYKNVFGNITPVNIEFIFLPILIFTGLYFSKNAKKELYFWGLLSLIGVLLVAGSRGPITDLYNLLFINIPGFSLFRDPSKFNFLIVLPYSILLAFSTQVIMNLKFNQLWLTRICQLSPLLILIYLIFLIRPIFLGNLTGMFSEPWSQHEFLKLAKSLESDNSFGRILWIPTEPPLGYSDLNHPVVESLRLVQKRPFAVGLVGQYEKNNYLREASFSGQLLDISGIGYISYPALNPRRDDMHPDNIKYYADFLGQLKDLSWLKFINPPPATLFKVSESQDRFFIAGNSWEVYGSDDIYNQTVNPDPKFKLSNNVFVFHDEDNGAINTRLLENPTIKILLNKKSHLDLSVSFIPSKNLIFPAKNLRHDPDQNGWWKRTSLELIEFKDFLKEKYQINNQDFDLGGGFAVAEGELTQEINHPEINKGNILLIRLMESPKGGKISFYQDNMFIGEVDTTTELSNLRWFEVGNLKSSAKIIMKTEGKINIINAVTILTESDWVSANDKANSLISQKKVLDFNSENIKLNTAKVSYRKINPTKYEVAVSDLSEPGMLVFSQNYDPLWRLDGKEGFKIYSFLNGFYVEKDGTYTVEFLAQKYLNIGFLITAITLFLLLGLIIFLSSIPSKLRYNQK